MWKQPAIIILHYDNYGNNDIVLTIGDCLLQGSTCHWSFIYRFCRFSFMSIDYRPCCLV